MYLQLVGFGTWFSGFKGVIHLMNSASWWVWVVWDQWLLIWFYHASRSTWLNDVFYFIEIWIVLIRCYPDINDYNIGWCTDVEETPVSNLWLSLAGGPYWRHPCPTSAESLCEALRIHELKTAAGKNDPKCVTNLPETNSSTLEIWIILPKHPKKTDGWWCGTFISTFL